MISVSEKQGAIIFAVCVIPRASQSGIIGEYNGALKIKLAAPPVDGAANAELIQVLAKFFDVAKSAIEITSGATSKVKQIKIVGLTAERLQQI